MEASDEGGGAAELREGGGAELPSVAKQELPLHTRPFPKAVVYLGKE